MDEHIRRWERYAPGSPEGIRAAQRAGIPLTAAQEWALALHEGRALWYMAFLPGCPLEGCQVFGEGLYGHLWHPSEYSQMTVAETPTGRVCTTVGIDPETRLLDTRYWEDVSPPKANPARRAALTPRERRQARELAKHQRAVAQEMRQAALRVRRHKEAQERIRKG